MQKIQFKDVNKKYGDVEIIPQLNLTIEEGDFVVLVGPSGCGKSTILRMIAGLEELTEGQLYIGEKDCTYLPAKERQLSMVFQDYALYPHMTVKENMAFSLSLRKEPDSVIEERVSSAAKMLDLESYLDRKPAALSGGQRQRVAMGRAVVKGVDLILYDEPLSNLDAKLRTKMRSEIKRFHHGRHSTAVYVTHDQTEAMTLADKLVVLNKGRVEQFGTPMEVFSNPQSVFVADFIGNPGMNFFKVSVEREGHKTVIYHDEGGFKMSLPASRAEKVKPGDKLILGIRPSDIRISKEDKATENIAKGEFEFAELLGTNAYLHFKIGATDCIGEIAGLCLSDLPKEGSEVKISFNLELTHFFDEKTGRSIL